jgi:hypothetical protein
VDRAGRQEAPLWVVRERRASPPRVWPLLPLRQQVSAQRPDGQPQVSQRQPREMPLEPQVLRALLPSPEASRRPGASPGSRPALSRRPLKTASQSALRLALQDRWPAAVSVRQRMAPLQPQWVPGWPRERAARLDSRGLGPPLRAEVLRSPPVEPGSAVRQPSTDLSPESGNERPRMRRPTPTPTRLSATRSSSRRPG